MPRPRLKPSSQQETNALSLAPVKKSSLKISAAELDSILRKKRSPSYIEAMSKLDAGGHVNNQDKVKSIIQKVVDEFPEIELGGLFLGTVSKCYLGEPYEVHTLDFAREIIEHFKGGETLPTGMEKARSLALHGGYAFVDVYTDCCRAVSMDGSVSVVK